MNQPESTPDVDVRVLLSQYQVAASHHTHFMGLIWQVPALTVAVAGFLAGASFRAGVPPALRAAVLLLGAAFILVMIVSIERYRMFQLRRRKDMEEIEARLVPMGGSRLAWSGDEIARQIDAGILANPGIHFHRQEGYRWLRVIMYVVLALLVALAVYSVAQALTGTE